MFINAGYFRAHMYISVPEQIRRDFARMKEAGTDAVTISVLEQDLFAAVENMVLIHRTAKEMGMKLYADMARWGGLVSGTPKVPSIWGSVHPEYWMRDSKGELIQLYGPTSSIYYEETFEFFRRTIEKMLSIVPFDGIFWNEPKALQALDYCDGAKGYFAGRQLDIGDVRNHIAARVRFTERLNEVMLGISPSLDICCFLQCTEIHQGIPEAFAAMKHLHTFGCDGRAWRKADEDGGLTYAGKSLLDQQAFFIALARKNKKKSFAFVENIDIPDPYLDRLDRRLPEVLAMDIDHLMYYYYGRSVESPDRCMEIVFRHLGLARK